MPKPTKVHGYKRVPIAAIVPSEENPRVHPQAQLALLARSIREFGFTNPLLVDEDNRLIAGHGRYEAAKAEGLAEVPVIVVAGLTEGQRRALLLADNQIAANAGWDDELLALNLRALKDEDFDLSMLGFSDKYLEGIIGNPVGGLTDPEDVPDLPVDVTSCLGDIWIMGKHRLMCGDSTSEPAMAALMQGQRAVACITDPPYSVNYEESHKTRGGDAKVHGAYAEGGDPTAILAFLGTVPCDLLIFSYSVNRHMFQTVDALRDHGWEVRKELIWVKDSFAFWAGAAYQQRHEPIWICTRSGASFRGNVDAKQSTVLEYPRPRAHKMHPTAKPVDLWKQLITNHSDPGELIVEPFSGSGTSLIVAEMAGRICYSMELAPQYVDVAVERWQGFAGHLAHLEADGRSFATIKAERHGQPSPPANGKEPIGGVSPRRSRRAAPPDRKAGKAQHAHAAQALRRRAANGKGEGQRGRR